MRPPSHARRLRLNLGLSQADVAARINRDPATVRRIELGRTTPRLSTAVALARLYDVPLVAAFPEMNGDMPVKAPRVVRVDEATLRRIRRALPAGEHELIADIDDLIDRAKWAGEAL